MRLAALEPSRVLRDRGVLFGCALVCLALVPTPVGAFESIRIETGPGGNAPALDARTFVAGDTLRLYAAAYDSTGAYAGGAVADWSAVPARATLSPAQGPSTLLRAVQTGSFELRATAGAVADTSGTHLIVPGEPVVLSVFTTPPGFSPPLDSLVVSADTLLVLYAGGFDIESNLVGYVEVDWSIDTPIATLVPDDASLTVLNATRAGSGLVRLQAPGLPDHDLPLRVFPGRLAELVMTTPPESLTALGDTTLAVAEMLPLAVTGFDADGNRVTGATVTDWRISGTGGMLTSLSGPQTTFEAQEPGSARIIASKDDVETSSGIVRVVPGPLSRLRVSFVPDLLQPVDSLQLSADDRLELWALGEDASGFSLGPVIANWTTTNPAVATTSSTRASRIEIDPRRVGTARIAVSETDVVPDTTGMLTVVAGATSLLRIETHSDGSGTEVGDLALSADSSLALFAIGRDADTNFTGLRAASWNLTAPIGNLSSTSGTTTMLDPSNPGTARITAASGGHFDETGSLSVVAGAPHHLRVEDTNGTYLSARLLRPGEFLAAFASLRDSDDNSIVRVPARWSWVGDSLSTVPPDSTSSFAWTAERTGRGRLRIETPNALPDTSGWITVTTGALSRLEIRDNYDAGGSIVGRRTLSSDSTLTLFAAAYDGGGNYLGEVPAQWTVQSLGGSGRIEPQVGSSTILQPQNAGLIRLVAQHSSGVVASTDTLNVQPGRLVRISIEAVTDSGTTDVGSPTLVSGDSLVLGAIGQDQWNNPTGPQVVDWLVTGGVGSVEPATGSTTTFVAGLVGKGSIQGQHSTAQGGETGEVSVQAGQAVELVIEQTSGDPYDPIEPQVTSTDDSLAAFAVMRDAAGNWAGDVNATWSIVDAPQMGTLSTQGPSSSVWFLPRRPATGRLRAAWTSFADTTAALQVVPGAPSGGMTVTAQPGSLRADGRSSVGLVAGPLRDRFDNTVADGTRVDFLVDSGSFPAAEDLDGTRAGLQRTTFNGLAPATLVAPEGPGLANVDASSGTARGALAVPILARAELAYELDSLVPSDVQRGDTVAVRLRLSHAENVSLHVQTATLRFDDGNDGAFSTVLSFPIEVPPGPAIELVFATRVVPEQLNLGSYAPIVELEGTDDFGHVFEQTLVLPPSSLQVTSLRLLAVRPVQSQVTRGDTLVVDVDCEVSAGTLFLDAGGTGLLFERPAEWTSWLVSPPDGTALSAGSPRVLRFHAVAGPQAATGPVGVDARARVTGRTSALVAPSAATTAVVRVMTGAQATFVSRSPASLARGRPVRFEVELRNDGDGDAILNPSTTVLADTTGGFVARLDPWGDTVLEVGATSRLRFEEAVWPASSALGQVPLDLLLQGSQDTGNYSATFELPAVEVRTPAFLADEAGSLEPLRAGAGSRPSVRLGARNTGGTALQLDTQSRIRVDGREATMAFPDSIPPQALRELVFSPIDLAGVALGRHAIELWARGTAEGAPFAQDLVLADSLEIVPPAALALVDLAPSQTRFTAGSGSPWSLDCAVANQGGITARLDSVRLRFWQAELDVTSEYTFDLPVTFTDGTRLVAPGNQAGLHVDVTATGSTLGPVRIDLFAKLTEASNGNDLGWISTEQGGAATVQIESPPALDLLALVASQPEVVVGQSTPWHADLVVENTGSADLELVSTSWTAEVEGSDHTYEFGFEPPEVFLGSGTRILTGNAQDTLRVQVVQTGTTPGALVVRARVSTQDALGGELLDELVQSSQPIALVRPAVLTSGPLLPSTGRVLAGGGRPWSMEIEVENTGQAELGLVDPETALLLRVEGVDRTADFAPQLASVPRLLEAAGRVQLRYEITSTPDLPGATTAELVLGAVETSSGRSLELAVTGAGPRIERSAVLQVVRLEPQRTSRGAPVRFRVDLVNTGEASAEIDTTTSLALGSLSVPLEIPLVLAPQETLQAVLEQVLLPEDQPLGSTSTILHVRGTQAGDVLAQDLPAGNVAVEAPAALTILGLEPSQPSVTGGQDRTWAVKMVVRNSGQAEYRVDSADLRIFLGGVDRTATYTLAMQKAMGGSLKPAENDTLRFVVTHTGDETGIATLEGSLYATDLNSGESLEANTFWGGKGTLRVEEPGLPVADPLQLSQATVTSGQTRVVEVILPLRNTGEAEIVLDTSDLSSTLESFPAVPVLADLVSGDPVLGAGDRAVLRYTLGPWNVPEGNLVLHATPNFVETNRALPMTVTVSDSLQVETPAEITLTQVDGPARVTQNQARPWNLRFTLTNGGASAASLENPTLVLLRDGMDVAHLFSVQDPVHFDGEVGTTSFDLPGGAVKTLTFTILSTDDTPGEIEARLVTAIVEQNSGRNASLETPNDPHVVRIEIEPNVAFLDSTLTPRTANHGQRLELRIRARNSGEATVLLDLERTNVRLEGTSFVSNLRTAQQIPGGSEVELQFAPVSLPPDVGLGPHAVLLHLVGTENDNAWTSDQVAPEPVQIDAASSLEVLSVRASESLVTATQTRSWFVRVAVRNQGAAARFESSSLSFALGAADVTSGFQVRTPTGFESGRDVLAAGVPDTLAFEVTTTGDVEGLVLLDALVRARDLNSNEELEGRSFGPARGSVEVARPARPVLVALHPSQETVSAGQQGDWHVLLHVRNAGGSPWRPDWTSAVLGIGAVADDSLVVPVDFDSVPGVLRAGEEGRATFRITSTGDERGSLDLVASLSGIQETDQANIPASPHPPRSIRSETQARARLDSLVAVLPRSPEANTGQSVTIAAHLANTGEASVTRLEMMLRADGASPAESLLVFSLEGEGQDVLQTRVRLRETVGPVSFELEGLRAVDANDTTRIDAWDEPLYGVLALVTETPGQLGLEVWPSQANVSAGQTSPWWVTVLASNTGSEPLLLRAPRSTDLEFRRGGTLQADYQVLPPGELEEGGLRIAGGDRGTLRYRITTTGGEGGSVEVRARLAGTHANDPEHAAEVEEATAAIQVDELPGLRILSTESVTWRRQRGFDDFRVNSGQVFTVRVVVENTGGTPLDSILVDLESERGNSTIEGPAFLQTLDPGERGTLDVRIVAGTLRSEPGLPESFTAHVLSARDPNSGVSVLPGAAIDNTSFAYVEDPAVLSLSTWIESPVGAQDGVVSTGQRFVVGARVENLGRASISESGRLGLVVPQPFQLEEGEAERFFAAGEVLHWTLRAPMAALAEPETLRVSLVTLPHDENNGEEPELSSQDASLALRVQDTGTLEVELWIASPVGAQDGTVSSGQEMVVFMDVRGHEDLVDRRAELLLPDGWSLRAGVPEDGSLPEEAQSRSLFTLIVGPPASNAVLTARAQAVDRNDGTEREVSATLQVDVKSAARLAVAAAIVEPQEARQGRVLPSQSFTLRAWVRNHGQARVASHAGSSPSHTPHGALRLTSIPTGFRVDRETVSFTLGPGGIGTAEWQLVAPAIFRPKPERLRVVFEGLPVDENSGQSVSLHPDSTNALAVVSIVDEGVQLEATPTMLGPAVAGQCDLPLLDLRVVNGTENAVSLDSLGVLVLERGVRVSDPRKHLARLQLVRADRTSDTLHVNLRHENPVWTVFESEGPRKARGVIAPGETAVFVLIADLAVARPAGDLSLALRSAPDRPPLMRAVQASSRTPLAVRTEPGATLASGDLRVLPGSLHSYNAPNPFHVGREKTVIHYRLDRSALVRVRIHTLQGELVWETSRNETTSGPRLGRMTWDGRNGNGILVRNGVYVCRVQVGSRTTSFKIAVAR